MSLQFERSEMLLGRESSERLASCRVALFGLGGVGGYCLEALARAGIGALDLIDADRFSVSNLNRQLLATTESVGRLKTEAAAERVRLINPACRVREYPVFFLPENADELPFEEFDYIVDAVDTVSAKLKLCETAKALNIPIISCMGTGNKLDPEKLCVSDISKTSVCPLAKVMRHELKARGIEHLKVVYSPEQPLAPLFQSVDADGRRSVPGSVSFVPSVAGLLMASEVIKDLLSK